MVKARSPAEVETEGEMEGLEVEAAALGIS